MFCFQPCVWNNKIWLPEFHVELVVWSWKWKKRSLCMRWKLGCCLPIFGFYMQNTLKQHGTAWTKPSCKSQSPSYHLWDPLLIPARPVQHWLIFRFSAVRGNRIALGFARWTSFELSHRQKLLFQCHYRDETVVANQFENLVATTTTKKSFLFFWSQDGQIALWVPLLNSFQTVMNKKWKWIKKQALLILYVDNRLPNCKNKFPKGSTFHFPYSSRLSGSSGGDAN